jgi:hypothetical protein
LLVETLQAQAPLRLRSEDYSPADVVKKIRGQLVSNPSTAGLDEEITATLTLLGNAIGKQGTAHLRTLYREYFQSWTKKGGLSVAHSSVDVATEVGSLGCDNLSQLFTIWADLKKSETLPAKCKELQRLFAYVKLVRVWETFNVKKTQAQELTLLQKSPLFQAFLDAQNLRKRQGVTQQAQLTSFIAHQLQLTNKQFTLTVSRYRPLAVLTKHLGDGILGFLPLSGLIRLFTQIRGPQGGNNHNQGEQILVSAINKAKSSLPGLTQLCDSVQENILTPILNIKPLPMTSGLGFLVAGNKDVFNTLPIWELVNGGISVGSVPRVEEILPDGAHGEDDSEEETGGLTPATKGMWTGRTTTPRRRQGA